MDYTHIHKLAGLLTQVRHIRTGNKEEQDIKRQTLSK